MSIYAHWSRLNRKLEILKTHQTSANDVVLTARKYIFANC